MDQSSDGTTQILKLDLGATPRVLLVDDDELVLERLRELVSAAGFDVDTAPDAPTALASLKDTFTPIVIMDRQMPGMDGLALCRAIRQQNWPGYVYILLLTVQDAEEDILAGLDAGADDYVSKRSSSAQLVARLRTARRILTLEHSLKNALEEKRRQSLTDALTGAPNRRYFLRYFGRDLSRARRNGGYISLMSLDIDDFKRINDRYGHTAGDAVLQEFVRRISPCLPRETDWCARVGGEEFVVVLADTSFAGAAEVAEAIRQTVAGNPVQTAAGNVQVTVSIGVSGWQAGTRPLDVTVESLLRQSDKNLYVSKESGRNRVTMPGSPSSR